MRAFRILLAACGLVVLTSTLAIEEPQVLRIRGPAAILAFVLGAGALAGDAVPLRPLGAACSAATMALALAVLLQAPVQPALGALMVLLQLIPRAAARRAAVSRAAGPRRSRS